ncbi:MAG TPA: glycosyltransferase family 2 protein [Thermoplasmata archaeon]
MIRVAVALVNFNGYGMTCDAIDSILPYLAPNDALVVVDNASTDGSVPGLERKYPTVRVIALERNVGYAGGCNAAIEFGVQEKARYVLLANNDIVFAPDAIDRLVETAETADNIGIVVPRIYYHDRPNTIWAAGSTISRVTGLTRQRGMDRDESDFPPSAVPLDLEMCTGCCMLVRTSIAEVVGGMREEFFLYYDETDWCWRIRRAGFRILVEDRSRIWHKVSETVGVSSPTFWYYITRNHIWFVQKDFPMAPRVFALMYFTTVLTPHRILLLLFLHSLPEAYAIIRGCVDGYRAALASPGRSGR